MHIDHENNLFFVNVRMQFERERLTTFIIQCVNHVESLLK